MADGLLLAPARIPATPARTIDVGAVMRRLDQVEPIVHAFVVEPCRIERVHMEASDLTALLPRIDRVPSLFGVPTGIKDIIRVDGLPTTAGSRLPSSLFSGPEASIVTRLRMAGALLVGKTVTAEFAVFQPGPTRNPHDPDRTPGGSSSGSAAAVAAGECALALGTQTIGSVTRPAAYCGVVGMKPTQGRMPGDGVVPCSPTLDQLGFFTQDVASASIAAGVLVDGWRGVEPASTRPVLAVPEGPYLQRATDEGLAAFRASVQRLRDGGYEVREVPVLAEIDRIDQLHRALMFGEMAEVHRDWFQSYEPLYASRTAELIRFGQSVPGDTIERAREERIALREQLVATMDAEGIDAWISPSATGRAPMGIATTGDPVMNLPWTNAGLPVITVPAGEVRGLPVGMQIVARPLADEALLGWAAEIAELIAASG
jgi:Asp-tRNA(Asn)/Glu-tRNA(Gln) amidotransferase A subunit family amidase